MWLWSLYRSESLLLSARFSRYSWAIREIFSTSWGWLPGFSIWQSWRWNPFDLGRSHRLIDYPLVTPKNGTLPNLHAAEPKCREEADRRRPRTLLYLAPTTTPSLIHRNHFQVDAGTVHGLYFRRSASCPEFSSTTQVTGGTGAFLRRNP